MVFPCKNGEIPIKPWFSHGFSHVFPRFSTHLAGDPNFSQRPVAWSAAWSHVPSRGPGAAGFVARPWVAVTGGIDPGKIIGKSSMNGWYVYKMSVYLNLNQMSDVSGIVRISDSYLPTFQYFALRIPQ